MRYNEEVPQTKERADTSRGQKRQNPCPSSLRASELISVHDNKLRSGTLLAFLRVILRPTTAYRDRHPCDEEYEISFIPYPPS